MEIISHQIDVLFAQLGLSNSAEAIEDFLKTHYLSRKDQRLADAPFWNASQASLLEEAIKEDAEWSQVVDQLDALLRAK